MPAVPDHELRLDKLAADVISLQGEVGHLRATMDKLTTTLEGLDKKFDDSRKTSWPMWGVMATLASFLAYASYTFSNTATANAVAQSVQPVAQLAQTTAKTVDVMQATLATFGGLATASTAKDAESTNDRQRLHEAANEQAHQYTDLDGRLRGLTAEVEQKLAEVETQFCKDLELSNVRFAHQERMNALLWEDGHRDRRWPTEPYHFPGCRK